MKYLILATIGTVLFFGSYWLLMRRETRFTMVRYYLLGTLLLSLLLPLIHLPLIRQANYDGNDAAETAQLAYNTTPDGMAMTYSNPKSGVSEIKLTQDNNGMRRISLSEGETTPNILDKVMDILPIIYWIGVATTMILLTIRLARLQRRLVRLPYKMQDGVKVSVLNDDTPAYSFGKHIVFGRNGFNPTEMQQLIGHEMVHVCQRHTLDLLLCEAVKVVLWFNPFVYLYQRELKRVHEYQADNAMLATDNGAAYAELFYHQVSGKPYSAIGNTFDYSLVKKRIAMMARHRSRHGGLLPLIMLPIAFMVLLAGCVSRQTLKGFYEVSSIELKSDNPAEPTLQCNKFMGLENRLFCFHRDGRLHMLSRDTAGNAQLFSYTIDDNGLHLFDSTGNPWLDMTLETLHCDGDSIKLRFVNADPIEGIVKALKGLPTYRYRIDTVTVSNSKKVGDEIIEFNIRTVTDTIYPQVTVSYGSECPVDWSNKNRLLGSTTVSDFTAVHEYKTQSGETEREFYKGWHFDNNTINPNARQLYDTTSYYNPLMEGDRFILEVTLKAINKHYADSLAQQIEP